MRNSRRYLLIIILISVIVSAFYFFWFPPRYVVPILMYHHFGYGSGTLYVTPENFQRQMTYLKDRGYNVIPLDQLVDGIQNNTNFDRKTVVITIDDGYKDNYTYAYPVLKKYDFPATIFIIANFIDNKNDYLSWEEIITMLDDNISFGGHTKNNIYLPAVDNKQILWDEIKGSKKLIEDRIKTKVDYFCYPTGGFTEEIKYIVRESGYKGACTTNRGLINLNRDVFELKRVKVTNSDMTKPLHFWAKLSGYYNLLRSKREGY